MNAAKKKLHLQSLKYNGEVVLYISHLKTLILWAILNLKRTIS